MERFYRTIEVAHLSNGQPLAVPIHELWGEGGTRTVGISAVLHGDEGLGVEILRRFVDDPDLENLRGRVILLPLANPPAFQSVTRNTPLDMTNLNRVFPGDAGGWLTEQLAHVITREFLQKLDVYVDVHSGGLFPIVDYVYLLNSPEVSRAFGRPYLFNCTAPYPGTTMMVTVAAGIPTAVVEIGGGFVREEAYAAESVVGLKNILVELGMLPQRPLDLPRQTLLHRIDTIRPHQGGLLVPAVRTVGARLSKGDLLGRVVSPLDFSILEEIRTHIKDGVTILTHPAVHRVEPGDFGFMVGDLTTAELLA